MIIPTVGRKVWYRPHSTVANSFDDVMSRNDEETPLDATVSYVFSDRMVNLQVIDHNGCSHARTSVPMLQDGDERPAMGGFCEWMPYQKDQAAKAEAAEKQ